MALVTLPDNVLALCRGKSVLSLPRGLRNNNPGNIRIRDEWRGLASMQTDKEFCQFTTCEYGIRAMAVILRNTYFRKRGRNTVALIVSSWAPPNENDTLAYQASVAKVLGVSMDDVINLERTLTLTTLISAIIKHENGVQPYTTKQIVSGVQLA
jgi:hypothetical protein